MISQHASSTRSRKSSARPCARANVGLAGHHSTASRRRQPQLHCVSANNRRQCRWLSREWNVKIEIYDQVYNVNADGNEEYLHELAAYVDGKMRSIADATHMVYSLKVAVLAALNIADETF